MKRLFLSISSLVAGTIALYWLLSEAAIRYEVRSTGALSVSDLGDDLGLGILVICFVVPASVIGGVAIAAIVWRTHWLSSHRASRDV